jgi:cytoskeletal protein CcmA (bactofilin family)
LVNVKKRDQSSGELEGFLDEGTSFSGEVSFHDTLRIDGKFDGAVRSGKTLVIGENADVNAEVDVAVVSVSGRIRGAVRASERIELNPTARAECSLDCKVLVVHEGAQFDGQCAMGAKSSTQEVIPNDKVKQFASSE